MVEPSVVSPATLRQMRKDDSTRGCKQRRAICRDMRVEGAVRAPKTQEYFGESRLSAMEVGVQPWLLTATEVVVMTHDCCAWS